MVEVTGSNPVRCSVRTDVRDTVTSLRTKPYRVVVFAVRAIPGGDVRSSATSLVEAAQAVRFESAVPTRCFAPPPFWVTSRGREVDGYFSFQERGRGFESRRVHSWARSSVVEHVVAVSNVRPGA